MVPFERGWTPSKPIATIYSGSVRYHKTRSPVLPTRVLLRLNRLRCVRFILVFHPRVLFSSPFTRHNLHPAFVVVFLEISTQLFNENTACNARRNDFSLFVFVIFPRLVFGLFRYETFPQNRKFDTHRAHLLFSLRRPRRSPRPAREVRNTRPRLYFGSCVVLNYKYPFFGLFLA